MLLSLLVIEHLEFDEVCDDDTLSSLIREKPICSSDKCSAIDATTLQSEQVTQLN